MTKILVLYYSTYGHIEAMAGAIAEVARSIEGTETTLKRVPETITPELLPKWARSWTTAHMWPNLTN